MRVVILDDDEEIGEMLHEHSLNNFTTVVPRGYMDGGSAIVLLSFGDALEFVGYVVRTRPVATQKDGLRCERLVAIVPPLRLDELIAAMPSRVRAHVGYRSLPPTTSREVLRAVERLRPSLGPILRDLRLARSKSGRTDGASRTIAMEKDAVGVAMALSNLDRTPLVTQVSGFAGDRPFLAGLGNARLLEAQILAHDLGIFSDWNLVRRSAVGSISFEQGDRTVTIINVNCTAIEETLGVDLVYYHEYFHAFVVVQYKRMERTKELGWLYRPDANHDREVERMQSIPSLLDDAPDALSYRLNPGACFFKLCESVVLDANTTELISGMYLPLDYLEACRTTAKGVQGGTAWGYGTVPRHLNNTEFISLVQGGWVGSAGKISDELRSFVEARVEDGRRSVMLAIGSGPPLRGRRMRRA